MRVGKVEHVDVVAHARAVAGRIIIAKNRDARPLAGGRFEHEGNQMRFGLVAFARAIARAGSIEIPQRDDLEAVRAVEPSERALEGQLRLAVGIDRVRRHAFVERRALGHAVDRARRRKDDRHHAGVAHRFEQAEARDEIVSIVARRLLHRLRDERVPCHVDDRLNALVGERAADERRVDEIALDECRPRGDRVPMAA